jgi:peptidoglycan-associated lipoprotein
VISVPDSGLEPAIAASVVWPFRQKKRTGRNDHTTKARPARPHDRESTTSVPFRGNTPRTRRGRRKACRDSRDSIFRHVTCSVVLSRMHPYQPCGAESEIATAGPHDSEEIPMITMTKPLSLLAMTTLVACSHARPRNQNPTSTLASAPTAAARPTSHRQIAERTPTPSQDKAGGGEAVYFDFDSANLRKDARKTLLDVFGDLRQNHKDLRIEGNCDERGTTEYNLVLGDRRARRARDYLERLGVRPRRITVVSYGSERPKAKGHDERAWAMNRRDDFVIR